MFERKVAQMQGASKAEAGAYDSTLRLQLCAATPQVGDFSFKHYINDFIRASKASLGKAPVT